VGQRESDLASAMHQGDEDAPPPARHRDNAAETGFDSATSSLGVSATLPPSRRCSSGLEIRTLVAASVIDIRPETP
jgi:hypothetical protein